MKNILREYGVIGTLLVVAIGGYFLIGDRTDDILAYSLDAIGHRLTALVADDASKADVAEAFGRFRARVDSNEVAPEQIESMAANILNLSVSGATLSSDEAEMVLVLATEPMTSALPVPQLADNTVPDAAMPLPEPPQIVTRYKTDKGELDAVGTRVSSMIAFAEKMQVMAESDERAASAREHYRFDFEDGLHVVVDTMVESLLDHEDYRAIAADLNRESWFELRQNMGDEERTKLERIKMTGARLAKAREVTGPRIGVKHAEDLRAIERFNRLQELGLVVKMDTTLLRRQLDLMIEEAMKNAASEIQATEEQSGTGRVRDNSK